MIHVAIVDDHPLVRAGLQSVLATASDIRVIAEGTSGAEALRLVIRDRPDVLVLDVHLPDMSGVEVMRQLREKGLTTAILILTVSDEKELVFGLLDAGANGYVLKDDALEILVAAVRAVARGESWLSPTVANLVLHRHEGEAEKIILNPDLPLTPREREVLMLLAQGLDNAAIAQHLVLTKRTVQNHVSNIYGKLGVASRTEAALLAIRHGLVQVLAPEDSHG
ncbi:MAG: response regulator transcription factor [Chloroflexi bacterium]|nr:response regulator transcription factor [Chloroflexota bacterium]